MKNKMWLKIILACGGIVLVADVGGLVPAMDAIAKGFPGVSMDLINAVLLIAQLFMVIFTFVAGGMCKWMSKKTVYLLGITLFTIGGVAGMFYDNIYYLLFTRAVTGAGAGLVQPSYNSLIADHFEENERTKVMGLSTGLCAIIGILIAISAGILASMNWHYTFLIYLSGLLILVGAAIIIPKSLPDSQCAPAVLEKKEKPVIGKEVLLLSASAFIVMSISTPIIVTMSHFIVSEGLGTVARAGLGSALITLGIVIGGFCFPILIKHIKGQTASLGLLSFVIGYGFAASARSFLALAVVMPLFGFGMGTMATFFYHSATTLGSKIKQSQTFIIGIVTSIMCLGQFFTMFYVMLVNGIFGNPGNRFLYSITGIFVLICAVISAITGLQKKRELSPAA